MVGGTLIVVPIKIVFKSVHGLCCYGNIRESEYDMLASACFCACIPHTRCKHDHVRDTRRPIGCWLCGILRPEYCGALRHSATRRTMLCFPGHGNMFDSDSAATLNADLGYLLASVSPVFNSVYRIGLLTRVLVQSTKRGDRKCEKWKMQHTIAGIESAGKVT